MSEEQQLLLHLLQDAVERVYSEKRPLLQYEDEERKGLEQAFVFRTGVYFQQGVAKTQYSDLDIDCEYNKNHNGFKVTANHPHGIRPDLLLHERNTHNNNKLAVEFKGSWTAKKEMENDCEKLKDITSDEYNYTFGIFVLVGEKEAKYRLFSNGGEVEYE